MGDLEVVSGPRGASGERRIKLGKDAGRRAYLEGMAPTEDAAQR